MVKNSYVFTLSVDSNRADNKYGIKLESNLDTSGKNLSNVTRIGELVTEKNSDTIVSFLDESKKMHNCHVSMIDYTRRTNVPNYNCYWCRNPFDTSPIGCPISYIPSKAIKTYTSEIRKDKYIIKENITMKRRHEIGTNLEVKKEEVYETDGVFCSFNCCKAFILDNKHNPLYNHSEMLLIRMYNCMFDTDLVCIEPAPCWRLLIEYGGHLNIDDFRESFNRITYKNHGYISTYRPIQCIYEEKIRFL